MATLADVHPDHPRKTAGNQMVEKTLCRTQAGKGTHMTVQIYAPTGGDTKAPAPLDEFLGRYKGLIPGILPHRKEWAVTLLRCIGTPEFGQDLQRLAVPAVDPIRTLHERVEAFAPNGSEEERRREVVRFVAERFPEMEECKGARGRWYLRVPMGPKGKRSMSVMKTLPTVDGRCLPSILLAVVPSHLFDTPKAYEDRRQARREKKAAKARMPKPPR